MNKVSIVGRLSNDPTIRTTTGDKATTVARFNVAVQRRFKNAEGNYDADFISCEAFGKTAEMIEKYFAKGSWIGIDGRIQTGNYTNKDGVRVYTTDVICENIEFVGNKSNNSSGVSNNTRSSSGINIPEEIASDEELPFN